MRRSASRAAVALASVLGATALGATSGLLHAASAQQTAAPADPELYEYGAFLARQCFSCHRARPEDAARRSGIPDIWSIPYATFEERFQTLKKTSDNPAIQMSVSALSEEDNRALLYYFRVRKQTPTN